MLIDLDGQWFIDDTSGYTLQYWDGTRDKNGNRIFSRKVYPGTLAQCVEAYAKRKVSDSASELDFITYVKQVESIYLEIKTRLDFTRR